MVNQNVSHIAYIAVAHLVYKIACTYPRSYGARLIVSEALLCIIYFYCFLKYCLVMLWKKAPCYLRLMASWVMFEQTLLVVYCCSCLYI